MKKRSILIALVLVAANGMAQKAWTDGSLKVSPNGHFLQYGNGTPFFWLGDTGWEMFNRLNKQEIIRYLDNRQQKGFNVIQAVILDDNAIPIGPNRYGDAPLMNNDVTKPNEKYFKMIDWAIQQAADRKMFIALLPTWGGNVSKLWATANPLFNTTNAYQYGLFLGKRYKDHPNIIWVAGGDRPAFVDTADWRPIWRAMIKGIKEGAGDKALITYHPSGESSSTTYWKDENMLDINMMQSGHRVHDLPVWDWVLRDYNASPAKPILDAEPNYEDHPINWKPQNGYFNAYDVRKQLYRGVFSGACGVTYGHHAIWQFYSLHEKPISSPDRYWTVSLDRPGAYQAGYLKRLILAYPSLQRVPDQSIIKSGQGESGEHISAFRDSAGTYAMIYMPVGKKIAVNFSWTKANNIAAWWFDPQSGKSKKIGKFRRTDWRQFEPPTIGAGNDWVLVLDDADKKYKVI